MVGGLFVGIEIFDLLKASLRRICIITTIKQRDTADCNWRWRFPLHTQLLEDQRYLTPTNGKHGKYTLRHVLPAVFWGSVHRTLVHFERGASDRDQCYNNYVDDSS